MWPPVARKRLADHGRVRRIRAVALVKPVNKLQAALAEATRYGYIGYQLEARLGLLEYQISSGTPGARASLQDLEKDARNRGFGLIARKAASARGSKPQQM
jgi:hypothetical protein